MEGSITGRVHGIASAPAVVQAQIEQTTESLDVDAAAVTSPVETRAAEDGQFVFLHLAPGTYQVTVAGAGRVLAVWRVNVIAGEVSDLSVLDPRAQIASGMKAAGAPAADWEPHIANEALLDDPENFADRGEVNTERDADRAAEDDLREEQMQPAELRNRDAEQRAAQGTRSSRTLPTVFGGSSLARLRVESHIASAQTGNGSLLFGDPRGAVTKAFHGTAFLQTASSAWAAADPYALVQHFTNGAATSEVEKPHDVLVTLGARLGGPLWHGRVAAVAGIEGTFRTRQVVSSPRDTGFFSLSATQTALLANRGVSAGATAAALSYLDGLTGPSARNSDFERAFLMADAPIRRSMNVIVAAAGAFGCGPAGRATTESVVARGRASIGTNCSQSFGVTAGVETTLWRQFTNRMDVAFQSDDVKEVADGPLATEPAIGPQGFAPEVRIGGGFQYGTPAGLGRDAFPDERRVLLADTAVLWRGQHILTAGAQASFSQERVAAATNREGTFAFDSGITNGRAGGLVDWVTDYTFGAQSYPNGACPSITAAVHLFCFRSFTQSFGEEQVTFPLDQFAGFVQDHWRLRDGLTADIGVRYEYTLLPFPATPNAALDAVFSATGSTSVFPEDRNNVAPRVALAWSPSEKAGVFRLGAGAFYGRLPGSTVRAALVNTALPGSVTQIRITPGTVTDCPQVANQGFGFPCVFTSAPPAAIAQTTRADVFARAFRLPVVARAQLGWARSFGPMHVDFTYNGAMAVQLPNTNDINVAPATGMATFQLQGVADHTGLRENQVFAVPLYTARLSQQWGPVTRLASNANATFHALRLQTGGLAREGIAWRATYTWSKTIDYGPDNGTEPRTNAQFDPFQVGYDKGLGDGNFPQLWSGSLSWKSALRRGPLVLQRTLTGWRVSALAAGGSGRPYSYEIFGGTHLSGGAYSINGSGGSAYLPTVGRNTLRLPQRASADVRVAHGFTLHGVRGEAAVTAFNALNHINATRLNARAFLLGIPANGVTPLVFQDAATVAAEGLPVSSVFGTVTASSAGAAHERRVQLDMRLSW